VKHHRTLFLYALFLVAPSIGLARAPGEYPKLIAYSHGMNGLPAAVRDTIARYDVVVCPDRPEIIADLRSRNPGQRYLWEIQPQYVVPPDSSANPWWMPDTLWSLTRLCQYYAWKNNWYLRDTDGVPLTDGISWYINWTQYCPVGTFGSAKGLRASQWIASVAMPEIALSHRYWDTWSWDSHTAYNGIMFEILADCLGSYGNLGALSRADPNRDGIPEGVSHTCSMGGDSDPLSVLFRAENEDFYARLSEALPVDFVFTINENSSKVGPWWRTKMNGMKFENWMNDDSSWVDWWDWFYGMTPPWLPGENWGAGYAWTETAFDKAVPDSMKGWDLSYVQAIWNNGKSQEQNRQHMRYGLGTTLLGDGYFAFGRDERYPLWPPEFDWNFGTPIGDYSSELHQGQSLYVRKFTRGMVEVNPNAGILNGVPPADSRFTFWLPVQDLHCDPLGPHSIRATFTAPHGDHNDADSYEIRYATFQITNENWDSASQYSGNPIIVPPLTPVTATLEGLDSGTSYSVAIRTHTGGRPEPYLSNPSGATTGFPPDTIPPGTIENLHATGGSQIWIDLAWTAPGDDGSIGTATQYQLRYLHGEVVDTEEKWARAIQATNLPTPSGAGTMETYRLEGLAPAQTYGVAVRALDDAGNISLLASPPYSARTTNPAPPPGDQTPPAAITDLAGQASGEGRIFLSWTAPGDDGWFGRATSYQVRILPGRSILTEGDWNAATIPSDVPPYPGFPHNPQTMVLTNLRAGSYYGVSIRTSDEAGNVSTLSSSPIVQAGERRTDPPPMDVYPPSGIQDLTATVMGDTSVVLQWTATGYLLRFLPGRAVSSEGDWNLARNDSSAALPDPAPAGTVQSCVIDGLAQGTYGAELRAIDDADNIGSLGPSALFRIGPPDTAPPEAPSSLRVSGPDDDGNISFEWEASSAADLAGYNIEGRRDGEDWTRVNTALVPAGITSVTLPSDGNEFHVQAVDTSDNKSSWSPVATLAGIGTVALAGPFPHPVREACRFEIRTPRDFTSARVDLVIRDAEGRTVRELYSGTAGASEAISVGWDRRDETGRTAAPGFYVAVLHAGNARILRKVFLSP
jgi:hypothetical protein